MKARLSIALALVALVAGCSSGTKVNPEEPATVDELDSTIQAASQALLANDAIAMVAGYFDSVEAEVPSRYDWIDYRPGGAVLAVYAYLDRNYTEALSLSAGTWMTALISDDETHPWQPESLGAVAEVIPAIARVQAMTTQQTPDDSGTTATKQTASDGSALWALTKPLADGTGSITWEWIINADGLVHFHRVAGEDGASIIVFEYAVADAEATPVIVPVEGTPLVLDDLGIPSTVRDLENQE